MKRQFSAGIIIYHEYKGDVTYLLLHYVSGHWDFPKGKIEAGETEERAAHRELKEETGLSAIIKPGFRESLEYIFKEHDVLIHKTVTFFVGKASKQEVRLSREHQGFAWLPYEEARSHVTYKNAREILKKAHDFIESN